MNSIFNFKFLREQLINFFDNAIYESVMIKLLFWLFNMLHTLCNMHALSKAFIYFVNTTIKIKWSLYDMLLKNPI